MSSTQRPIRTASVASLRWTNARAVLDTLADGPLTITQVASSIDLSRTAVEAIIARLGSLGWVRDADVDGHPGPGRPARGYAPANRRGTIGAIDIGPHTIRAAVADLGGNVLAEHRVATPTDLAADARLDLAVDALRSALASLGHALDDLWAVAAASPGVVQDGVVAHFVGMEDWAGRDLAGDLERRLGRPVAVENDCNLAALAERWRGAARGIDDFVFVLIGNRTGAGLVLDGALYRGARGGSGEIGALPQVGWSRAPEALAERGQAGGRESVFERARIGDERALAMVDDYASRLAVGIAALQLTLDPTRVVVGGGVVQAGTVFLDALAGHVESLSIVRRPDLVASTLGERVVLTGAVRLALDVVRAALDELANIGDIPAPSADIVTRARAYEIRIQSMSGA